MKTGAIHQVITINAPPARVYGVFMDSRGHSEFTGCPARISRQVGGSFTAMDSLRGKNLEIVPNERIVQTWQCDYDGWPSGHFSILILRLEPARGGTRLKLDQIGVPAPCIRGIGRAWHKYYWQPLKKMFRGKGTGR